MTRHPGTGAVERRSFRRTSRAALLVNFAANQFFLRRVPHFWRSQKWGILPQEFELLGGRPILFSPREKSGAFGFLIQFELTSHPFSRAYIPSKPEIDTSSRP